MRDHLYLLFFCIPGVLDWLKLTFAGRNTLT